MLLFYGSQASGPIDQPPGGGVPDGAEWIDAFEPSDEERAILRSLMGVEIPKLSDLLEIESSSRLSTSASVLLMNLPAVLRDPSGFPRTVPVGFVLSADRLVTLRYARLPSFEGLMADICARRELAPGGMGATVTILDVLVDQVADLLEQIGTDLDGLTRQVFAQRVAPRDRRPRRANERLSQTLRRVGENGALIAKTSETLLGLSRMTPFLSSKGQALLRPELKIRLESVSQDAKSLREQEDYLTNRTQFLLDALLGLANIEQNNVFRVLTVASVIGIPPTFFASMYGMNFKYMPEYDWSWGYPYGLTIIAMSALIPAVWFKLKGWW